MGALGDRRGPLTPVRASLAILAPCLLALALVHSSLLVALLTILAVAAAAKGTTVVSFADYRPVEYVAPPEEFIAFQRKLGIVVPAFVFPAESTYWLSLDDPHPNVEGHAELSRRMLAGLATEAACMPPR